MSEAQLLDLFEKPDQKEYVDKYESSAIDFSKSRVDFALPYCVIEMLFQNYLDGVILIQLEENQKNKSKVIYMNACAKKIFDSFSKGCEKINKQVFKPFFND